VDVKTTKIGIVFSSDGVVIVYHFGTDEDIFSDDVKSHEDISDLEKEIILLHVKLWKKTSKNKQRFCG
jgi:hypothetical protein